MKLCPMSENQYRNVFGSEAFYFTPPAPPLPNKMGRDSFPSVEFHLSVDTIYKITVKSRAEVPVLVRSLVNDSAALFSNGLTRDILQNLQCYQQKILCEQNCAEIQNHYRKVW